MIQTLPMSVVTGADPTDRPALPTRKEMLLALRTADATYDGLFVACVRTTGVFCRPSCSARKPRPENVEFTASPREALLAGFRPCKRCRPMDADGRPPAWVARLFSEVDRRPSDRITDGSLREIGIDPARARRYFLTHYGMTFQAYHRARRMGLALNMLHTGGDTLGTGFDAGYESSSGFRDAFTRTFGAPPGRGRHQACIVTVTIPSPIGPLIAAANADGLCLLEFADRRALQRQLAVLRKRLGAAVVPGENKHLKQLSKELSEYFAGIRKRFDVPLVIQGTPFQERVWRRLLEIPFGASESYQRIARDISAPTAVRAVGRANGDNRIAILIPCHRVVGLNGKLTGYGGGLWRKQHLLDLERTHSGPGLRNS